MVQYFRGGPSRSALWAQMLGPAAGQGLGSMLSAYQTNKALEGVLNDPQYKDKSQGEKMGALQTALGRFGERGQKAIQQRLMAEQQIQQEEEQKVLARVQSGEDVSDKDLAKVSPQNQFKAWELKKKKQFGKNIYQNLVDAGYPESTAKLWQQQAENTSEGGLTDVVKNVNDLLKRSKSGKGFMEEEKPPQLKPSIEIPGVENKTYDLDFPELREPTSRTNADLVKEEEGNKKTNAPLYAETIDSLNSLDEDFRDLKQLQTYNEDPEALPTGLEKWNVDWDTGDLRFKGLASPKAQDYVKIIARMLGRAKEYFPGRVTNFDLSVFRQRFPTLANNPEGRQLIAKQLSLANRIAYLKDETLKAAIDHYGSGSDPVQIRRYAQENYRRLKDQLEGELAGIDKRANELASNEQKPEMPEGTVHVRFGDQEGYMPKEEYERAIKDKKQYELIP